MQTKDKSASAARNRAYREQLRDWYIIDLLGIPRADCPKDLIELKREQIEIARFLKQLNKLLTKKDEPEP